MDRLITIDPAKIIDKIGRLQEQIKQLHALLDQLDNLGEFAVDASNGNGRGRPAVDNPLLNDLREFVVKQHGDFTHKQLKAAIGNPDRRDRVRAAIEALEAEGLLDVVEKPMGRNPGLYRRKALGSD